jgi:hypothetical protein
MYVNSKGARDIVNDDDDDDDGGAAKCDAEVRSSCRSFTLEEVPRTAAPETAESETANSTVEKDAKVSQRRFHGGEVHSQKQTFTTSQQTRTEPAMSHRVDEHGPLANWSPERKTKTRDRGAKCR